MTRIVMVSPHFPEYAYRLALALSATNDVRLIMDLATLDAEYEGRVRPVSPQLSLSSNRFETAADFAKMFATIRQFDPEIIHWQEPSGLKKAFFAAATIALMRRTRRLALTIHDPMPHEGRDSVAAGRLVELRRYTRRRVHRLFVHGKICRDQYLNEFLLHPHRDDRLRMTQHGAILTGDREVEPRSGFSVLMFGRMEAYKGLDVLCDAVEWLARQGRRLDLTLAGAGPELDRLESRFRAQPGVKIENRFVASSELVALIGAAGCVVLPYTSATQSGVLAGAFGNGRPVIASRVGGIPDMAEDGVNALLVPPGEPVALADAILRLWDDAALRARLRDGASQTGATDLNWSTIAAALEY